jgi:hypothetical protein
MVKAFALSTLVLAGTLLAGAVTFLCKPPGSSLRSPKKFKLLTCTLVTFSILLLLLSVALLKG